jgi:hypothetical protein
MEGRRRFLDSGSQSIFGWAFHGQACLIFSDFPFQPVARKKTEKKEKK